MRYAEYKTIGTSWVEFIPTTWDCKKIGTLFSQRKTKVSDKEYPALSVAKIGVVPQLDTAVKTDAGDNRKLVCVNDFVINSRSDRKGSCGVSELDGSVSLINIVLTPRQEWNNRYVHYLLRSQPFSEEYYRYGRGIVADLWTTRYSEMKNILLPVPPHAEQDHIVRYLDWQVSKINRLIAAKKKQIAFLRERAQKLIQDVVFHGITNGRALDTYDGLWIGSIPSDWNVKRIKNLFSLRDERNHMPLTDVNLISLYTSLGVVQNCDVEYKSGNKARTAENYKIVHNGDIVVNIILCWMGAVGLSKYNGVTSPAYDIYVPNSQASSRYYHYLFRLPVFSGECKKVGHGIMAMRWRTYSPEFRSIYVPVPPYEEQEQIADWLDKHMSEIEKLIEPFKQEIDTLHELRTRLISDVVTGQIDVRGIEVPDFDMVEEIDSDEVNLDDEDAAEETEEQEE